MPDGRALELLQQLTERVDVLSEAATRGLLLGQFVRTVSEEPFNLEKVAELGLQVALDGGSVAESGSLFVAVPTGDTRELRLVLKVARTSENQVVRMEHREYSSFKEGVGVAGRVLESGEATFLQDCGTSDQYLHHSNGAQLRLIRV